ncbi:SDR family oxidoreductase [Mangrovitalea sediminis]|uniref:SDR family oxidoreductase n=1 Tax=Mangrovitalea sediminis TaxID=1982043 RepID=UPI000BE5A93B|nr:SDR family oxidoreductase [Mangrovitalea sediminis]
MSASIFVTGATGTIGSALQNALSQSELNITWGTHSRPLPGLPSRPLDYSDPSNLERAFAGHQVLFLLLPLTADKLQWARNAIEAAKAAGVRHIVRSSGAGADPASPYSLLRLNGEIDRLVQASGLSWTLIRPSTFMQNFATYYSDMIRGGSLYLPQGEGKTAFVDARDIAAVDAEVLANPERFAGEILTVTGAEALDNATAMARIGTVLGREMTYVPVDDEAARQAMTDQGAPDWLVDWMLSLHRATRDGHTAEVTDTVASVTGRPPRPFDGFAGDYAETWH